MGSPTVALAFTMAVKVTLMFSLGVRLVRGKERQLPFPTSRKGLMPIAIDTLYAVRFRASDGSTVVGMMFVTLTVNCIRLPRTGGAGGCQSRSRLTSWS